MKTDRRSMIVLSFELTGLLLGGVQQKALDLRDPLPQSPDSFCLVNHPHCEQVCWGRLGGVARKVGERRALACSRAAGAMPCAAAPQTKRWSGAPHAVWRRVSAVLSTRADEKHPSRFERQAASGATARADSNPALGVGDPSCARASHH